MSNDTNTDLKDRITEYEEQLKRLEERLKVEPVVTLEFPQYRVLPDEVLLALKIIERHDKKFMLTYKDLKGDK